MLLKPDSLSSFPLPWILAILALGLSAAALIAPQKMSGLWKRFPRSFPAGCLLSTISMVWAILWMPVIVNEFVPAYAPLFAPLYQLILPAAILLLCFVLRELLSCRATGFLFVLIPTPLLSAVRYNPSPARYLIVLAAYILAVYGMFLIAKPWILRDTIFWCTKTPKRFQIVSAAIALYTIACLAALCVL